MSLALIPSILPQDLAFVELPASDSLPSIILTAFKGLVCTDLAFPVPVTLIAGTPGTPQVECRLLQEDLYSSQGLAQCLEHCGHHVQQEPRPAWGTQLACCPVAFAWGKPRVGSAHSRCLMLYTFAAE